MDIAFTPADPGRVAAPQLWNATPSDIRLYPSVTIFCRTCGQGV